MVPSSTLWNSPGFPACARGCNGCRPETELIAETGSSMCSPHLPQQIDGMLNHVFNRRHRRDVGLIASAGAHEVDHIFGRIDARHGPVTIGIGVRVAGHIAPFRLAVVQGYAGDLYARGGAVELG